MQRRATSPYPTDAEILDRFYRLNATIGLTRGMLNTLVGGNDVVSKIERGTRITDKTRWRINEVLIYIEAGHTEPIDPEIQARLDRQGVALPEILTTGTD